MKHDYRSDPDSADAQQFLHWLEEQAGEHLKRDFGNADATRGSIFLFVNRACEAGLPDRLIAQIFGRTLARAGYGSSEEDAAITCLEAFLGTARIVHGPAA